MSERTPKYGLLVDYEYCTGCHSCEIACAQEFHRQPGMAGIRVMEIVQTMPNDKAYLVYLPFPTELCILCAPRTKLGLEPACVKHCMASCMKYGRIEELAKELNKKPRMALWVPRQ